MARPTAAARSLATLRAWASGAASGRATMSRIESTESPEPEGAGEGGAGSDGVAAARALGADDVTVTLVKGGDHRLSTDADMLRLIRTVERLSAKVDGT